MKYVEDGGIDKLHMTFYTNDDIGDDGVWDLWQIEGPSMVWYFRGAPTSIPGCTSATPRRCNRIS